ncbi:MAG: hypothetical protein KGQ70_00190 [Alphaproteobacteria bacterium]|nr:hypothetical protein [Alphaproteobacteria bacterium]
MVIDHIDAIWFHHALGIMMYLGRATFPLFCYAVAMAVIKAHALPPEETKKAIRRYLVRLLVLALVTQPFYLFALRENIANVIFTLAGGIFFADLSTRARPWQMYLIYAAAILSMLWVLPIEFGLAGVVLPAAFLQALRGNKGAWPFLIVLLLVANAGGIFDVRHANPLIWAYIGATGLFSIVLPWLVLDAARHMRQGKRFLPKYALHVFYPGHMVALRLIWMAFH